MAILRQLPIKTKIKQESQNAYDEIPAVQKLLP